MCVLTSMVRSFTKSQWDGFSTAGEPGVRGPHQSPSPLPPPQTAQRGDHSTEKGCAMVGLSP